MSMYTGLAVAARLNREKHIMGKSAAGSMISIIAIALFLASCSSPTTQVNSTGSPTTQNSASSSIAEPTFAYPGDPRCTITYRDDGHDTMSWTAKVTIAGELITHASDSSGNTNRHDVQVIPGSNTFTAPVPLSQIGDIGGVLYAGNASYGCSIAPQR